MKYLLVILLCSGALGTEAGAWWGDGHGLMTRAAMLALPEEVPAFFREGGALAANVSFDADLFKHRAVPQLDNAEHGEHFIDLELLEGKALPLERYDFIELCQKMGLDPERVGLVPYAIAEWTQRLAIAFAEHRRWPHNEPIQQKCLVYAGFVAHYAQDLCQPLHVTVHFNGKKLEDGTVVGKGIHEQVDSVLERIGFAPQELAQGLVPAAIDSLMGGIAAQLEESHALVDQVYALMGKWEDEKDPQVGALAQERAREAVRFTASLYLTAWQKSAQIRLPGWLKR
jgi:hypothetical protein